MTSMSEVSSPSVSYAALRAFIKFELLQSCKQAQKLLNRYIENGVKYQCLPIGVRTNNGYEAEYELSVLYNADAYGDLNKYIIEMLGTVHERLHETADALKKDDVEEAERTLHFAERRLAYFGEVVGYLEFHVLNAMALANAFVERGMVPRVNPLAGAREEMFLAWSKALVEFSETLPKIEV